MDLATALGLVALALSVGIYGTIIGAGGGFIVVAGLVVLFDLSGATAVGTSVITTLFIHVSGAFNYNRKGLVDRPTTGWFATGSVPVAFVSAAFLANRIPQQTFEFLIGALLLALAVFVLVRPSPAGLAHGRLAPRRRRLLGSGAAIGVLSGAFGVGSGLITVPLLGWVQKLPTHRATATTSAIGVLSGLSAGTGHVIARNLRWDFLPFLIAGALIGGRIGSNIAERLSPETVRALISAGLLATGVPLLIRAL
ncbi:MAG: sulfite exporter TauE/SafE family protein [Acidimicrobiia bacterium]|nr:sulfite exporter TauE/SafE family protein [Acidimicrobiia bacterium]